jgi:hypothetical protein
MQVLRVKQLPAAMLLSWHMTVPASRQGNMPWKHAMLLERGESCQGALCQWRYGCTAHTGTQVPAAADVPPAQHTHGSPSAHVMAHVCPPDTPWPAHAQAPAT